MTAVFLFDRLLLAFSDLYGIGNRLRFKRDSAGSIRGLCISADLVNDLNSRGDFSEGGVFAVKKCRILMNYKKLGACAVVVTGASCN